MSGVELSAAIHDLSPDKPNRIANDDLKADDLPDVADLLIKSYFNSLRKPLQYAETMAHAVPGLARLGQSVSKGDVSRANQKGSARSFRWG